MTHSQLYREHVIVMAETEDCRECTVLPLQSQKRRPAGNAQFPSEIHLTTSKKRQQSSMFDSRYVRWDTRNLCKYLKTINERLKHLTPTVKMQLTVHNKPTNVWHQISGIHFKKQVRHLNTRCYRQATSQLKQ